MPIGPTLTLAVAGVAAWIGFGGVSGPVAALGQIAFFICLVVFMVALVLRSTQHTTD
jgi:uncharacterized membrane protein YtjA (UPF0391 family)